MQRTRRGWSFHRRNGRGGSVLGLAAGLALVTAAPATADEAGMALSHPWVRSIVPSRPASGYFTLRNDTSKDRKIVSASSPACGMLMLHLSKHEGGEHMATVDSVEVPAHGSISFEPGGTVVMTPTFDDGGTLTADFPVRNAKGE